MTTTSLYTAVTIDKNTANLVQSPIICLSSEVRHICGPTAATLHCSNMQENKSTTAYVTLTKMVVLVKPLCCIMLHDIECAMVLTMVFFSAVSTVYVTQSHAFSM